jgi:hypothetical protein
LARANQFYLRLQLALIPQFLALNTKSQIGFCHSLRLQTSVMGGHHESLFVVFPSSGIVCTRRNGLGTSDGNISRSLGLSGTRSSQSFGLGLAFPIRYLFIGSMPRSIRAALR